MTMTGWAWVHILAATSGLVVAALALAQASRSPLARPLALLAVDQVSWDLASVGSELTHQPGYEWLGAVSSPLFVPFALHFVLTFLGRRRQLRWVLVAAYVTFGLQALLALLDLVVPGFDVPGGLATFGVLVLGGAVPFATLALVLMTRHLRAAHGPERQRTVLLLVSVVLVTALTVTDPLADLDVPVPRLATLGSFAFNAALLHLTLGLGLFSSQGRRRAALGQAAVLGLFVAVAYLTVFVALREHLGVLMTALTALSLALAVAGWFLVSAAQRTRAGLERFATLGRFSAQMAHDLKNPLAAAKGAAEYLAEELRRAGGGSNEDFARLVVQQLERLHAVIDRYQRLSKLEPQLAPVDLNQLVTRVLSLQQFATPGAVTITRRLAEPAPHLQADADLLASALENLVKNALEAMPEGGTLTVSTEALALGDEPRCRLTVRDTGPGFDARAREQAFELFFTTRAQGSGLGLAFVRQVARAHGGEAHLDPTDGRGAQVSLTLPARAG